MDLTAVTGDWDTTETAGSTAVNGHPAQCSVAFRVARAVDGANQRGEGLALAPVVFPVPDRRGAEALAADVPVNTDGRAAMPGKAER